jgi:hypothetical protein
MIGRKKLTTIREELRRALAEAADGDPISCLEQRIAVGARKSVARGERDEIVQSLRRILDPPTKKTQGKRRVTAAK